ncbi:hypothetical protein HHL16_13245 [Pseudoflavitalea sp. G-6-1-2]|uniref:hypothetical protein n=1 Tax=Pseudoflavitalea sp. G-6-1-2 TaxID=2728841 RepID=UPI00146F30FA|nr:hypothetical protein [Pseudoflavitalea sp. G-6-1-2]NML21850.1 hypothetical protein [Pseudoflavitalea sp. G-6-1-2]
MILLLGLSSSEFYAQVPNQGALPQIIPKSPNVAGFEKYGKIPVSLSTGVPEVSIPLTTINIDGLSIPVTLSYHNNGVKPKEIASWVGYGWNLQFGGTINWQIRGLSDFSQVENGLY